MSVEQNVTKEIQRILKQEDRAIFRAYERWAEIVVKTAKELAPKDTGFLANSIGFEMQRDGVLFTVGVDYGIFVEFGTVKMEAQPYLFPAFERHRDLLPQFIAEEFGKI